MGNVKLKTGGLSFTMILIIGCVGFINKNSSKIIGVELFVHIQVVNPEDATLHDLMDSTNIFKFDNYMVYKKPYTALRTKMKMINDTMRIDHEIIESKVKYHYVVYNSHSKYGFWFDSTTAQRPKKISVDSAENENEFKRFPFFTANDSLISVLKSYKKPLLTEARIPKLRVNDTYPDSKIYYYTNDFNDAPITFSSTLDSVNKLKLYKVRVIYNAIKKGKYPINLPAREFYFELRKAKPSPEIPLLIEKFKKLEGALK